MIRLATALLLASSVSAAAHELWINRERLVDPVTKRWCCDSTDCFAQPAGSVKAVPGGYQTSTGEVFPGNRVLWRSPDGKWWRCGYGKKARCLIGPPTSF